MVRIQRISGWFSFARSANARLPVGGVASSTGKMHTIWCPLHHDLGIFLSSRIPIDYPHSYEQSTPASTDGPYFAVSVISHQPVEKGDCCEVETADVDYRGVHYWYRVGIDADLGVLPGKNSGQRCRGAESVQRIGPDICDSQLYSGLGADTLSVCSISIENIDIHLSR